MRKELGQWRKCGATAASILKPGEAVSIAELRWELCQAQLQSYGATSNYAAVRFCRGLICAMGCQFKDGLEDWEVWRNMSKHVRQVVQDYGLEDYTVAIRIRDALRKRLAKAQYSLGDLICYLCLANLVSEDSDQ